MLELRPSYEHCNKLLPPGSLTARICTEGWQLAALDGVSWIMGMLLYGTELRVRECLRLRIKDVDFGRDEAAIGCSPAPERASRTGLHAPFLLGLPK